MPALSVIIPTLNAAETLATCLDSIENLEGLEVVMIDGGSGDNTLEIASSYPFVQAVSYTQIKGIYPAMNHGIEVSNGEWLLFLGADDQLVELPAIFNAIANAEEETDLIIGSVKNTNIEHSLVKEWYHPKWDSTLISRNIVHHQGALYRRRIFENYRYPQEFRIFGDYHLNLHLFLNDANAELVDKHFTSSSAMGRSKVFDRKLYLEEWKMKKSILPFKHLWWQPVWILLKYFRKKLKR